MLLIAKDGYTFFDSQLEENVIIFYETNRLKQGHTKTVLVINDEKLNTEYTSMNCFVGGKIKILLLFKSSLKNITILDY